MKINNHYKQGFTLIEILLAISIMSLVLMGVYATFWGGVSLSKRSQDNNQLFREIRWAIDLVSRDLENMVPYDFSGSYENVSAFAGKSDTITFLKEVDGQLKAVSYALIAPDEAKRRSVSIGQTFKKNVSGVVNKVTARKKAYYLVREQADFLDYVLGLDSDSTVEIISMHVADGGLRFSFGFTEGESKQLTYKPEWDKPYIPSHVKVDFDFLLEESEQSLSVSREVLIPTGFGGSAEEEVNDEEEPFI